MKKKVQKELKKHLTGVTLFFAVLFLIIGVVGGFIGYSVVNRSKDDTTKIELNGDEVIELELGEKYKELGATFIINGIDYENDVEIINDVNTERSGIYVVTYTLKNELYNISLKRVVCVGGESNGE